MDENPFKAQTNPYVGDAVAVGAEVDPSGLRFHLTVCLILAILGIVASCMGPSGLRIATERTRTESYEVHGANASADLGALSVTSNLLEGTNFSVDSDDPSIEVLESSFEIADATGAESDLRRMTRVPRGSKRTVDVDVSNPVVRISNVVMFLLGFVTSVVLLMGSIKGMRRKSGAPKAMCNALALAVFYKALGIFLGILSCLIYGRGMSNNFFGLQIAMWATIGFTAFATCLAALMAGYYVYARGVFKRSDVVAYFESK